MALQQKRKLYLNIQQSQKCTVYCFIRERSVGRCHHDDVAIEMFQLHRFKSNSKQNSDRPLSGIRFWYCLSAVCEQQLLYSIASKRPRISCCC